MLNWETSVGQYNAEASQDCFVIHSFLVQSNQCDDGKGFVLFKQMDMDAGVITYDLSIVYMHMYVPEKAS